MTTEAVSVLGPLYTIPLSPGHVVLPVGCASCGAVGGRSKLEPCGQRSLHVPYCEICLSLVRAGETRQLAALVASCLLGSAGATFSPAVWPWANLSVLLVLSSLASLVPFTLLWFKERRAPALVRWGRAAWCTTDGKLVGTNQSWMTELGELNGSVPDALRPARKTLLPQSTLARSVLLLTLALPLVVCPVSYLLTHPKVWILNLTTEPFDIEVDGHRVVTALPATSGESAGAGVRLRLPAGKRHWLALANGMTVDSRTEGVAVGAMHLYAPGADDYCFWIETTTYGRVARGASAERRITRRPLASAGYFWSLAEPIHTWFAPNPPSTEARLPASGGQLSALRQARCVNNFDRGE